MKETVLVFLGGGAGSVLRYLISRLMLDKFSTSFPWATLSVNLLGCLLIGLLIGYSDATAGKESHTFRLLLGVGFCGGFTTFSAFALENIRLVQTGQVGTFVLYAGGSLVLGLGAVLTGLLLARLA